MPFLDAAPARAQWQQCPYLRQQYQQWQQGQMLITQYQAAQARQASAYHAAQTAYFGRPTVNYSQSPYLRLANRFAGPTTYVGSMPSRTTYLLNRPTRVESISARTTYSLAMICRSHAPVAPGPGPGLRWTEQRVMLSTHTMYQRSISQRMQTEVHQANSTRMVARTTPGMQQLTAQHTLVGRTHSNPGSPVVVQRQVPQMKEAQAAGGQLKVTAVNWQSQSSWSYARCGRCHPNGLNTPQPAAHPQPPRLNDVVARPRLNLLAEKPQGPPKLAAEKPPLQLFDQKPQGPPKLAAARPPIPLLSQKLQGPPRLAADKPPLRLFTPQPPGAATWQPRIPSLAMRPRTPDDPGLPLPLVMGGSKRPPSGRLPDADWWTPPSPGSDNPGRVAAEHDLPMLGQTGRVDLSQTEAYQLPPPVYPPLPRAGWEPPPLSSDDLPESEPLPALLRVADAPPANVAAPPSLLPLPAADRSWGPDDTVTLK
jgi:hypothetical protein